MTARTANLYPVCLPGLAIGKVTAADGDTFTLPFGNPVECMISTTDDDDGIASGVCSGRTVTVGLIDDAGVAISSTTDLIFTAILVSQ